MKHTQYTCGCGRRMGQYARKCQQCWRTWSKALAEREQAERAIVNEALRRGLVLTYRGAGTQPHTFGRQVKFLYEGVPGTWSVDTTGSHWSQGSTPTAWVASAQTYLAAVPA